ncbi:MAG: hypothetical protein ABW221_19335 [Vicinamibacteria bacterium]
MKSWQDLLTGGANGGAQEYGPRSQAIRSVFEVLSDMPWFEKVGQPLDAGIDALAVPSWDEAVARPGDGAGYLPSGHLAAPSALVVAALADPQVKEWWSAAREDAYDHYDLASAIPADFDARREDVVDLYVEEFVGYLLAEVLAVPPETSSHFRLLMAFFSDGRFPCGWDGTWPEGKPRVY